MYVRTLLAVHIQLSINPTSDSDNATEHNYTPEIDIALINCRNNTMTHKIIGQVRGGTGGPQEHVTLLIDSAYSKF